MEIKWFIFAIGLGCLLALVLFLIKRDQKDKKELIQFLNKTEVDDESEPKDD